MIGFSALVRQGPIQGVSVLEAAAVFPVASTTAARMHHEAGYIVTP